MNQTIDAQSHHAPEAEPRTPWESIDPDERIQPPPALVFTFHGRPKRRQTPPPLIIAQHLFEQTPTASIAEPAIDAAESFAQETEDELIERAYFSDAIALPAPIPAAPSYFAELSVPEPVGESLITAPVSITRDSAISETQATAPIISSATLALDLFEKSIESPPEIAVVPSIPEHTPWESIGETSAEEVPPIETFSEPDSAPHSLDDRSHIDEASFVGSASADATISTQAPPLAGAITCHEAGPTPIADVFSNDSVSVPVINNDHPVITVIASKTAPARPLIDAKDALAELIASSFSKFGTSQNHSAVKPKMAAAPMPEEEFELVVDSDLDPTCATAGGGWTIPVMCVGIGLIACCVIIPQAEANRFLMHEHQSLATNLQSIEKQVSVNDGFLKSVADNPTLAERLASRQLKTIRKGERVLEINQMPDDTDMSPFALVDVAVPRQVPPYAPIHGAIADMCNNIRSRLYLIGLSLIFVAVGLVLGSTKVQDRSERIS